MRAKYVAAVLWLAVVLSSSAQPTILFGINQTWKYDQTSNYDGLPWMTPAFDASAWPSGSGVLAAETNPFVTNLTSTSLTLGRVTYYFRTTFNFADSPTGYSLVFSNVVDDGAVYYLNGAEIYRYNMTNATSVVAYASTAVAGEANDYAVFTLSGPTVENHLVTGLNLMAVEVHQNSAASSDVAFGLALSAIKLPIPPTVSLSSPTDGTTYAGPTNVTLSAIATDSDGSVVLVEFFDGGSFLGQDNSGPYSLNVPLAAGVHSLTAVATDSQGAKGTSAVVTVTVSGPPLLKERFNYGDGPLVNVSGGKWTTLSGGAGQAAVQGRQLLLSSLNTEAVSTDLPGGPYSQGQFYLSLRLTVTSLPQTNTPLVQFKDNAANFGPSLFLANNGAGGYRVGIARGQVFNGVINTDLALNTQYRLVLRRNLSGDTATLWINPLAETTTTNRMDATDSATVVPLAALVLEQNPAIGTLLLDDLRLATTFDDAVNWRYLTMTAYGVGPGATLVVDGAAGQSVVMESSADMNSWSIMNGAVLDGTGQFVFNDATAGSQPTRFYRVRVVDEILFYPDIVGVINLSLPTGYSLLSNPFIRDANRVSDIIPQPVNGFSVFKPQSRKQAAANYLNGWSGGNLTLLPGEGFWVNNPGASTTLPFWGRVVQGGLTNNLPTGLSYVGSMVPAAGNMTSLNFPAANGDAFYFWTGFSFSVYNYFDGWVPNEPNVNAGMGFVVNAPTPRVWVQTNPITDNAGYTVSLSDDTNTLGTLNFFTYNASDNSKGRMLQTDGVTPLNSNYVAQVYAGTVNSEGSLVAVGQPVRVSSGALPGYAVGGIIAVPGSSSSQPVYWQVRVWDDAGGTLTTYEAASGASAAKGKSAVLSSTAGGAGVGALPPALKTFASFTLELPPPASYTWNGGSGDWSTAANWTPNGVPSAADSAVVNSGTVTVSDNRTVANLTLGGGTLDGAGTLTVTNLLDWAGGAMTGAGITTIPSGATVSISGAASKYFNQRWIENAGLITWSGIGAIHSGLGAQLHNAAGGVVEIQNDQTWNFSQGGAAAIINNDGTFRKVGGTGTTFVQAAFNNAGQLLVTNGVLSLPMGSTSSGSFTVLPGGALQFFGGSHVLGTNSVVSGGGTVQFSGGDASVLGGYTVGNTVVDGGTANFEAAAGTLNSTLSSGILGGSGTLTVTNSMTWTGTTMAGAGITIIPSGATLNIFGAGSKHFTQRRIENAGLITWSGIGAIHSGLGAQLHNAAGGVVEIQNDQTWNFSQGGAAAIINNDGTFRKVGGTGTTFVQAAFNNAGQLLVTNGVLSLQQGSGSSGSITVSPGATLQFFGGSHVLGTNSVVSGGGAVRFSSGDASVLGGYTVGNTVVDGGIANFEAAAGTLDSTLSSGSLGGSGTLTVTNLLDWTGGAMTGAGITTIPSGATVNISGAASKYFNQRRIENAGLITWSGIGAIHSGLGAQLHNAAGGVVEIQNDQGWYFSQGGAEAIINNDGTFRKLGGTGTTSVQAAFNNYGTMDIRSGVLGISGNFNSAPTSTLGVVLGGTAAGTQFSQLQVSGTLTLDGGLSVVLTNGFVPTQGNTFQIITATTRNGSFTSTNGVNLGNGKKLLLTYQAGGVRMDAQDTPPSISVQPQNQSVEAGGTATFSVTAGGTAPLSYQWRLNNVNIPGATSSTFTLNNVQLFDSGGSYAVVVTNVAGAVTSQVATLTVTPPTSFTWNGGSGDWSTAGNWTPNGVPGATHTATINGGAVTVSDTRSTGTLNLNGGEINGGGTLTVNTQMNWTAGNMNGGGGRVVIAPTATLSITNPAAIMVSGRTLENQGLVTWTGNQILWLSTGAIVTNAPGGVIEIQNNIPISSSNLNVRIDNAGVFRKRVATGTTIFNPNINTTPNLNFNNYGTLSIQSGILNFQLANFNAAPSSTLQIGLGGGNAGTGFGQLQLSGVFNLNGGLDVIPINNFAPSLGAAFQIITASARSGKFVSTSGLDFGSAKRLLVSYEPTGVALELKIVPAALLHRYPFTTDARDAVGGADGTPMNGASFNGGALNLDGISQYVNLPNNLVTGYTSITMEMWVTDTGSGNWARIYDFGNSTGGEDQQGTGTQYMFLTLPSGLGTLRNAMTTSGTGAEQIVEWIGGRPAPNQRSHIVWTSNGGTGQARLYVDGVLVGSNNAATLTPAALGNTVNNWLGRSQFLDPNFKGSIDEFRIYNAALTAAEVQRNYQLGPEVLAPDAGPPTILIQPTSRTATVGSPTTFSAIVAGSAPLQLQWYRNNTALPGATSQSFTLNNVQYADAGFYYLVASNSQGRTASSVATLSVSAAGSTVIGLYQEFYGGINTAGSLSTFTNDANFPNNPTSTSLMTNAFENQNLGNNYGQRIRAVLTAPTSGSYTFWVASDDQSELYLSTDATPVNKTKIASVPDWTNFREWNKYPSQQSSPISLTSGQKYYVEVLHAEGGGGTHLSVRWQLPNATIEEPIPATRFTPYPPQGAAAPPVITQPPSAAVVAFGGVAAFSVGVQDATGIGFQWSKDFAPIAGATNPTLRIERSLASDAGLYSVAVSNSGGIILAGPVRLEVMPECVTTPVGAVAWWRAESNAVDSVAEHFGQLLNGTTFASGKVGLAFQFDGVDGAVRVPNSPSLQPSNVTVECWMRGTGPGGYYLVSKALSSGGASYALTVGSNAASFYINSGNTFAYSPPAGGSLLDGRWHHIAGTYDGATVRVFTDGIEAGAGTPATGNILYDTNLLNGDLFFSGYGSPANYLFPGQLDEITIYNRALSPLEILRLYLADAAGKCNPPQIIAQPQDLEVAPGSNVTFSVVAQGIAPLRYHWRHNGRVIPDATNDTYAVANVQFADAGGYSVVVSDDAGVTLSETAFLLLKIPNLAFGDNFADRFQTNLPNNVLSGFGRGYNIGATREVDEPLHVGKHSSNSVWFAFTSPAGGIATLSLLGSGFDTLLAVYKGNDLATLEPVASDDDSAGLGASAVRFNVDPLVQYQVAIDSFNHATGQVLLTWSIEATANKLPEVTNQPTDTITSEGASINLNVGVTVVAQIEWLKNGETIANTAQLSLNNIDETDVGTYLAVVTVNGETTTTKPIVVQFNRIDGRTDARFAARDKFLDSFDPALFTQSGLVKAARKPFGRTSGPTRGYVGTQVFNTYGASSEEGEPVHCGIIGGASEWFAYQAPTNGWLTVHTGGSSFDTILAVYYVPGNIPPNTFAELVNITCDNNGYTNNLSRVGFYATAETIYYVAVDGIAGATGIAKINYELTTPPSLAGQPASQVIRQGGAATFTASANGTNLTYQWQVNGSSLPGATNTTWVLTNAQPANSGNYWLVITNSAGAITSSVGSLTVLGPVHAGSQPTVSNGQLRLVFENLDTSTYLSIQGTTNLVNWFTVWSNTPPGSTYEFIQPAISNRLFLRAAQGK